jgi:hypothetical protein
MRGFDYYQESPSIISPACRAKFSAQGPGSMLGWAITVMGSELPANMEEEREYLRCRWSGIHGLGMKHSLRAAELLEVSSSTLQANWRRKFGDGKIEQKTLVARYIQSPPPLSNAIDAQVPRCIQGFRLGVGLDLGVGSLYSRNVYMFIRDH